MKELLETFGIITAPPSVVTALLYWLGYQRSYAFWRELGAHDSILGFSTTDYITRAMDTTFLFLGEVMAASILAVLFHRFIESRIDSGAIWPAQLVNRVLVVVGAATTPVALAGFLPAPFAPLDILDLTERSDFVAPAATMCSTLSLAYAGYLRGRIARLLSQRPAVRVPWTSRALVGLVLGMVVLSLFWMADVYATSRGQWLAKRAVTGSGLPVAVVYSKERLGLEGIQPAVLDPSSEDVAYRYKYSGLRFLLRSKESYLFLSPTSRVIVLRQSPQLRIEYPSPAPASNRATTGE